MPRYKVDYRNSETNMLHTSINVLAPDEETARQWSDDEIKAQCGVGKSADGAQSTVSLPRFTVAVTEIQ